MAEITKTLKFKQPTISGLKIISLKNHLKMTQNLTVPIGRVLFKFYDDRSTSNSCGAKEKIIVGRPNNYCLIIIPPLVWYSFENIFDKQSLIANCSSIPHDPTELKKDIPKIIDF